MNKREITSTISIWILPLQTVIPFKNAMAAPKIQILKYYKSHKSKQMRKEVEEITTTATNY